MITKEEKQKVLKALRDSYANLTAEYTTEKEFENIIEAIEIVKKLTLTDVGNCQFEAYAIFCIECDRKGIKPLKYKDYLEIG